LVWCCFRLPRGKARNSETSSSQSMYLSLNLSKIFINIGFFFATLKYKHLAKSSEKDSWRIDSISQQSQKLNEGMRYFYLLNEWLKSFCSKLKANSSTNSYTFELFRIISWFQGQRSIRLVEHFIALKNCIFENRKQR